MTICNIITLLLFESVVPLLKVLMMSRANIAILAVVWAITIPFSSCVEEEPLIVPDVYVNITINLELPQYIALKSINNALLIPNEGYADNGVVIYRYSPDEYLAFDATCPQHIETSWAITLDENGYAGTATCTHCNTSYTFFNFGQASEGYPLKRYRVSLSGLYLTVSN